MPFGSDALSVMAELRRVAAAGWLGRTGPQRPLQGTPLAVGGTPLQRAAGASDVRTSGPRLSGAADCGARPERS